MRVIAPIEDPAVIERILSWLGLWHPLPACGPSSPTEHASLPHAATAGISRHGREGISYPLVVTLLDNVLRPILIKRGARWCSRSPTRCSRTGSSTASAARTA